jgi:hypothetical protein
MKTFTQVSQILDFAQDFHQHCEDLYRQLRHESVSYAVSLLIEQMERHERAMKECLTRYKNLAPASLMETWVQYAPEESAEEIIKNLRPSGSVSLDAVFAYGKQLDTALTRTYAHLAENAESEEVRELFAGLLVMLRHGAEKRKEDGQALQDHLV